MDLTEFIKHKRPSLSASSIKTYNSVLSSLYKKVFEYSKGDKPDTDKFDETTKILKYLEELPPNRRKTILSALVVITDKKEYREAMLDDINNYNADIKKQEKTESQKENWVEGQHIKDLWSTLKRNTDLLYKKNHLTPADLQQIQSFIIVSPCHHFGERNL